MLNEEKVIYVYDCFSDFNPVLLGELKVNIIKGEEVYSFEYDENWLKENKAKVNLDPELLPFVGRQFPEGKNIFGVFSDACPDRWGRTLMNKRERLLAQKENRKPNKLHESDYLLGVYDKTRMGGLRFKLSKDGPFLSDDEQNTAPPWTSLRSLEEASRNFENDEYHLCDKWINQLIKPGSSLGGARPKATVIDPDGQLWIAKFPSKNDEHDNGVWEKIATDLARMCGLNVPDTKLEKFSKYGSTFLSKRFDRDKEKRIHFASSMTLLGKKDGESASEGVGYLDIISFIKSYGANPKNDLVELWKRIVFNMAITNTDDHLRNHAFICTKNGWVLSPLYDVNPTPYGNELSLLVDNEDNSISLDLAIKIAPVCGIEKTQALNYLNNILNTVNSNWQILAKKYGLSNSQIEYMRPAFKVCESCQF